MLDSLLKILAYIWQAPQNLIGIILRIIYKQDSAVFYKGKVIRVCKGFPGGISLGDTVIVKRFPYDTLSWNTVKHEWGHTRQSLYLGPLYLLVIGIPSLIWAACYTYDSSNPNGYYEFYTEKWADKLGGVVRE